VSRSCKPVKTGCIPRMGVPIPLRTLSMGTRPYLVWHEIPSDSLGEQRLLSLII